MKSKVKTQRRTQPNKVHTLIAYFFLHENNTQQFQMLIANAQLLATEELVRQLHCKVKNVEQETQAECIMAVISLLWQMCKQSNGRQGNLSSKQKVNVTEINLKSCSQRTEDALLYSNSFLVDRFGDCAALIPPFCVNSISCTVSERPPALHCLSVQVTSHKHGSGHM